MLADKLASEPVTPAPARLTLSLSFLRCSPCTDPNSLTNQKKKTFFSIHYRKSAFMLILWDDLKKHLTI